MKSVSIYSTEDKQWCARAILEDDPSFKVTEVIEAGPVLALTALLEIEKDRADDRVTSAKLAACDDLKEAIREGEDPAQVVTALIRILGNGAPMIVVECDRLIAELGKWKEGAQVERRVIRALKAELAALEEESMETAGILSDVCGAAFADPMRAEAHGYQGVLDQVKRLREYHGLGPYGAEAEDLRRELNGFLVDCSPRLNGAIQSILDKVSARDSLAYLESQDKPHQELRDAVIAAALTWGDYSYGTEPRHVLKALDATTLALYMAQNEG